MPFRFEVRVSGEGGQGLVLAGRVLAEAAAIYAGLNATQSQSYGPEARGGMSRSEVILSDGDIDYPKAVHVDLLLALTQVAFDAYVKDLRPEGVAVLESRVQPPPDAPYRVVQAPILKLAEERVGRLLFANMVSIGMMAPFIPMLPEDALRASIAARVPKGTVEKNLLAFSVGLEAAAQAAALAAGESGARR
jgi:2-oxoglutarate ferredoxin oxidoreductase subunit gamma